MTRNNLCTVRLNNYFVSKFPEGYLDHLENTKKSNHPNFVIIKINLWIVWQPLVARDFGSAPEELCSPQGRAYSTFPVAFICACSTSSLFASAMLSKWKLETNPHRRRCSNYHNEIEHGIWVLGSLRLQIWIQNSPSLGSVAKQNNRAQIAFFIHILNYLNLEFTYFRIYPTPIVTQGFRT